MITDRSAGEGIAKVHRKRLNHLQALEAESLYILREAVAEFARPVMLYSIGKDSSVMLRLAQKAFYPGKIPFPLLHIVEPTMCCAIRKVEPLMRSLEPYSWWFTGLRREQSPTRAGLRKIEDHRLPTGKRMKKVSVLADWDWASVEEYAQEHGIPRLALYDRGYTSIGCEPCTAIPAAGADPRSGRWGGKKLECGIHTFRQKQ